MEANHIALIGGTFRQAEDANLIALDRLSARALSKKPRQKPAKRKRRTVTAEDLAAAGVSRKPAPVVAAPTSPCGHCGLCMRCKRERRVLAISSAAKSGNLDAAKLMWEMSGLLLASQLGHNYRGQTGVEYPFARLVPSERSKVRDAGFTFVCDRSVPMLGEWRR